MRADTGSQRDAYSGVWVFGEVRDGAVKPVTFELLGAGGQLAAARGTHLCCVLFGQDITTAAARCFEHGADTVLVVDAPALHEFADDTYGNVLGRLIRQHRPEIVLFGATALGRALAPRLAVQLETGLTADCTSLAIDVASGDLVQTRPAFGGNIMAAIVSAMHRPQMATVRPRVMEMPDPVPGRGGKLIIEHLEPAEVSLATHVGHTVSHVGNAVSLADARFIIAGGRGVRNREGFELLRRLAAAVGGAVGASRAAVDAGWIDYAHQIGQTGQTVQPRAYVACGVSGQVQHLVGMQSAQVIVAINKDRNAPIMALADYAVVGDLFEIIPTLISELRRT